MASAVLKHCPICASGECEFDSIPLPNLYSEQLAAMLGISERALLEQHANYRCTTCDVRYKKEWFAAEELRRLFRAVVPEHPKGWDAVSTRFSYSNFVHELGLYERALASQDVAAINRYRRALTSLLDSTATVYDNPDYRYLFDSIRDGRVGTFHRPEVASLLEGVMSQPPVPFKRFAGFAGTAFWQYLEARVGPIAEYGELGCPLWGLAKIAASKGIPVTFFRRDEPNYWGDSCSREGVNCARFLEQSWGITVRDWSEAHSAPEGLLGFFQYLDHLDRPTAFLDEVFTRYRHAAVVLDHVDDPVYIQHLTGFSEHTMAFLAERYGKRLHVDFQDIRPSGNILYLLTDARS